MEDFRGEFHRAIAVLKPPETLSLARLIVDDERDRERAESLLSSF